MAEEAGLDTAWLPDHHLPTLSADRSGPHMDAWTLLPALAAMTRSIRIGVLVTNNNFRHPAVLARMAANVDVISGGRLEFGIGAGWFELEHTMYGISFPGARERLERMEEAIHIAKLLWTQPGASFNGSYYQLHDAFLAPKPVQQPRPPILVGARGEKLALRIVARQADEWNCTGSAPEIARKGLVLEGYCREIGRDPREIKRSATIPLALTDDLSQANRVVETLAARRRLPVDQARGLILHGNPGMVVSQVRDFVGMGVTHIILQPGGPQHLPAVRRFAREVAPAFRTPR